MVDRILRIEQLEISRVRQFGLYPLWTSGNLKEFAPSKKLLLHVEMRDDNVANNGEAFTWFWFENYICRLVLLIYNSLEDRNPLKGNTVGSRSMIEKAYIAGFLDGDGSLMLQLKRRSDTGRGYRFMATICFYQDTRHEKTLFWIQSALGAGYISRRNDGISELRINGFEKVRLVLEALLPFVRFKKLQAEALVKACRILENNVRLLSEKQLGDAVEFILIIQNENYKAHRKKTREELLKILDLTP